MATTQVTEFDLEHPYLSARYHISPEDGYSILDYINLKAGRSISNSYYNVSPILAELAMGLNLSLPDDPRQELIEYADQINAAKFTAELEQKRAWMVFDWDARVATPAWLRAVEFDEHASELANLDPITNLESANRAYNKLDAMNDVFMDNPRDKYLDDQKILAHKIVLGSMMALNGLTRYVTFEDDVVLIRAIHEVTRRNLENVPYGIPTEITDSTVANLQKSSFDLLGRMIDCIHLNENEIA